MKAKLPICATDTWFSSFSYNQVHWHISYLWSYQARCRILFFSGIPFLSAGIPIPGGLCCGNKPPESVPKWRVFSLVTQCLHYFVGVEADGPLLILVTWDGRRAAPSWTPLAVKLEGKVGSRRSQADHFQSLASTSQIDLLNHREPGSAVLLCAWKVELWSLLNLSDNHKR